MTYSELLHSVDFDDIAPYIAKYHGNGNCMAMYKIHYDILRGMTPHREEGDNEIVTISYYEPVASGTVRSMGSLPVSGKSFSGIWSDECEPTES